MQRNQLFTHVVQGTLSAGALALTRGSGIAFADDGDDKHKRAERGKAALANRRGAVGVLAADASGGSLATLTFTVTTKQGDLKVATNADTKFHLGLSKTATATVADLKKGVRVAVEGQRQVDGTLLARMVLIGAHDEKKDKKDRTALTHTEGSVTAIDLTSTPNKITVQPSTAGAAAATFNLTAQTRVSLVGVTLLKTGQLVTVVTKTGSQDALLIHQRTS
jgi:hypothetical protein